MLSLVFVPSFYSVMDDITRGVSFLFGPLVGPKDEPQEEPSPARIVHEAYDSHAGRGTAAAAE